MKLAIAVFWVLGLAATAALSREPANSAAQDLQGPQRAPAAAPRTAYQPPASMLNFMLLELQLDDKPLADSLNAYELADDLLLPLGELARLLTLGIQVDQRTRTASGFVVQEERGFRLDMDSLTVTVNGTRQGFDPAQVRWMDHELYVSRTLLQAWWPIDFELNMSALLLKVLPREKLPLQFRLERERLARQFGSRGDASREPDFPAVNHGHDWVSMPSIDQTLGFSSQHGAGHSDNSAVYSALANGDLAGMEVSLFVTGISSNTSGAAQSDARLTLSRNDPQATLLGPLNARSFALGNVAIPSLGNVLRGSGAGDGVLVSNRPLSQPANCCLQTLLGDLPPGWDVTLYFNDALTAFQLSRPDGLYAFEDQPLVFGANEFRLVFHGPLGQTRVERQVYMLDQRLTKPAEFFYTLGGHRGKDGSERETLQMDLGLAQDVAATAGVIHLLPAADTPAQQYTNIGLRTSAWGMLLNADLVQASQGGALSEMGLRTRWGRMSVDLGRTTLRHFTSDFFRAGSDPVQTRDRARFSGSLPVAEKLSLPVGLDVFQEQLVSGRNTLNAQARVSVNVQAMSLTHSLQMQSSDSIHSTAGVLQMSLRMAGMGLSSQIAYSIKPEAALTGVAVSVDKSLRDNARLYSTLLHSMESGLSAVSGGYNRNFGSFGLGVNARYSSNGDLGVGVQLFMALSREPQAGNWKSDWQPMATMGAISARAFLDANMNGQFDPGEQPVEHAGFLVNGGSRHPVRTGPDGIAYLSHMPPGHYTDIALDNGTLEDPQWVSGLPGVRVLPRPGKAMQVDFPVLITGEIDGTVFFLEAGKRRGIGNAEVELVTDAGTLVATVRSASDGYYVLPELRPGHFRLRISPAQLLRLGLSVDGEKSVEIAVEGSYFNGMDFTVSRAP